MGLPPIIINFRTAGSSAVRRSARGQAVLLAEGEKAELYSFSEAEQAESAGLAEDCRRLLRLCFLGGPAKVLLARYPTGEETAALARCAPAAEGGWLCAPQMDAQTVTAFVKSKRAEGRPLRAVVSSETGPDCAGIVNLTTQGITVLLEGKTESVDTADYCARIAGILAGLSLRESATYYPLPEVTGFVRSEDEEADIAAGRLILDQGSEGARIARAVTSLTTLSQPGDSAFQKIKIAEGVDLIRADIRSVFESEYVGKVLNDYDSKLLLVTAINSYFAGLEGSVLDTGRRNTAAVDFEAQKHWLEGRGVDTAALSDTAILSANTGSQVFLRANLRFADAMEDLTFEISM